MRWLQPVLLAAGTQLGAGWVTLPQDYTARKLSWPVPADPLDDSGLGGGLAFAIDAKMCELLLPVFKEDNNGQVQFLQFVNCEEINDAIARAMTTWSLNHPYVKFYNVTDECIAEGTGVSCSLAELYIDAKPPAPENKQVAAYVQHNPEGYGRDYGTVTWDVGVRQPSGDSISQDWIIKFSTLTFHNHICWYLDATFCAEFRVLNESIDATLMMQFIIWGVWALSFLVLFLRVAQVFFYIFRYGATTGLRKAVMAQTENMLLIYVLLFGLIAPPVVWFQIFTPCLTCYDFEATAAHEIGHVLGFTHGDQFPEKHRVATVPYSAANCDPALHVPDFPNAVVEFNAFDPAIDDSLMFSLTTKRSKTCLSPNDLQGLLYQYPVCDDNLIHTGESICVKSERNIGWVRFLSGVLPPFIFASVGLFLLVRLSLYYEESEQARKRWKLGGRDAMQSKHKGLLYHATADQRTFARGLIGRGLSKAGASFRHQKNQPGQGAGTGSTKGEGGGVPSDVAFPEGDERFRA